MTIILDGTSGVTFPNGVVMSSGTSAPVTVAQGGTGSATLTANNVLLGNGTSALQAVAPGTSGNVLTSNGTTWTSSALPAGGVTSWNGVTGAVTSTTAYDIGSFVIGRPQNTTQYTANSTVAGSSLYATFPNTIWSSVSSAFKDSSNNSLSSTTYSLVNTGSWRCVSIAGNDASPWGFAGLWVRYA